MRTYGPTRSPPPFTEYTEHFCKFSLRHPGPRAKFILAVPVASRLLVGATAGRPCTVNGSRRRHWYTTSPVLAYSTIGDSPFAHSSGVSAIASIGSKTS